MSEYQPYRLSQLSLYHFIIPLFDLDLNSDLYNGAVSSPGLQDGLSRVLSLCQCLDLWHLCPQVRTGYVALHPLPTALMITESPYFFNAGVFHSAALVSAISTAYAHTITDFLQSHPSVPRPDVIFGYAITRHSQLR